MAKSGYLPDISSRFSFWTEFSVNCLQKKDWKGAAGGLHNINSCLDEEYLVSVSTNDYNQKIADTTTYQCTHCKIETPYSRVKVFDLICPMFEGIITGEKTNKIWICQQCHKDCRLKDTVIIKEETVQPFFYKVVPAQPSKQIGLQNRFNFEHEFNNWFYNFLEELQHQLALYRTEYIAQTGHDMADAGYKHEGDSS